MVDPDALVAGLTTAGVRWRRIPGRPIADWSTPGLVAEPGSAEEAAAALAAASKIGAAVVPVGGATRLHLGNRPRAADLCLSTARLDRVIEHEPANLTVIVEAGVRLSDLQARLVEHGQFLPLGDLAGTIGGIVATNCSGPLRLGLGTARDLLIGSRVATSDGKLARAGGKVVKNVAGYDLGKLYVGSYGTLGVLIELALKLAPLPAARGTCVCRFPDAAAAQEMVLCLLRSSLQPLALEGLSPAAAAAVGLSASPWTLVVMVGGVPAAVTRQVAEIRGLSLATGGDSPEDLGEQAGAALLRRLTALGEGDSYLGVKASVPIPDVPGAVALLARAVPEAGEPMVWARAGSGIVFARWPDGDPSCETVAERLLRARRELVDLGGALVIESAPVEVRRRVDVWGEVGSSIGAMRALKQALDPSGTLNPGRFVGGI